MNETQIDQAILSVASRELNKVAMVISETARVLGSALPEGDTGHCTIAERIEILVREGKLVAEGNIKKWRHSEVRLP